MGIVIPCYRKITKAQIKKKVNIETALKYCIQDSLPILPDSKAWTVSTEQAYPYYRLGTTLGSGDTKAFKIQFVSLRYQQAV